jgi:hypothetical protein
MRQNRKRSEAMSEPEAQERVEIAQSLNCRGMICPLPIYKTSMALKGLAVNDVLEIVCSFSSPKRLMAFRRSGSASRLARDSG